MKILSLWDNYSERRPRAEGEPALACCLSDSCLLRERRPFYVPDFDDDFRLFPTLAVRISRLGKCIPERFAGRYWGEASVWLNARACTLLGRLQREGLPLSPAVAFDNSLIASPFFSVTAGECAEMRIVVELNGNAVCEWNGQELRMQPDEAISSLSKYMTLKMGDVILMGTPPEGVKISIGDSVGVFRVGPGEGVREEITRFNIK